MSVTMLFRLRPAVLHCTMIRRRTFSRLTVSAAAHIDGRQLIKWHQSAGRHVEARLLSFSIFLR